MIYAVKILDQREPEIPDNPEQEIRVISYHSTFDLASAKCQSLIKSYHDKLIIETTGLNATAKTIKDILDFAKANIIFITHRSTMPGPTKFFSMEYTHYFIETIELEN